MTTPTTKTTSPRKPKAPAKPTEHKIIALTSSGMTDSKFADIESQLAALSAAGWTVHITEVDLSIGYLTVHGHATR